MLEPGSHLATYEVRERLAVGGMGEVYLCRHRLLDRIDAVKVLRPHLVADQAFRRRFLREALSAAKIRHPHIVTVYTADEVDGQLYLAMEYVPGIDLAAILNLETKLEPLRAAGLLAQVADALDAAHRQQMTHRDVKPSNVLVEQPEGGEEHAYLVDFGLSKSAAALDQDITMTGQVLGTVAYIAPEQLQNAPTDGRCDQYSLACMAFQTLTGRLPFPRENHIATITAHLTTPPPSVKELRPELPAEIDAVIARGMAKKPPDRYETCSEFVAAIYAALEPPPVKVTPPRRWPGAGPPEPTTRRDLGPLVRRGVDQDQIAADDGPAPNPDSPGRDRYAPHEMRRSQGPAIAPRAGRVPVPPAAPVSAPPVLISPAPPVGWPQPPTLPPTYPAAGPAPRPQAPEQRQAPPEAPLPVEAWLFAVVVGGPDSGRVIPLPEGDTMLRTGGLQLSFGVAGWNVRLTGVGAVHVNGEAMFAPRYLAPGDVVDAGPTLLEVRPRNRLIRLVPSAPPDAVTLSRVVHEGITGVVRGPQHPQTLIARVGWRPGRPPAPIAMPLSRLGGITVRGGAEVTAGFVRWLIAQTAALHDPRDLCMVVAAAPSEGERWTWASSMPHARPTNRPLSGPHLTTNPEGAADLGARLRELVEVRRTAAADGPTHGALVTLPRVLAILDDRLRSPHSDYITALGGSLGVHTVRLIAPGARPPEACGLLIELDPSGNSLVVHLADRPGPHTGVPDTVSSRYIRDFTDFLPEG